MVKIQSQLDNAIRNGGYVIIDYNLFFDRFQGIVSDLFQQCKSFTATVYLLK